MGVMADISVWHQSLHGLFTYEQSDCNVIVWARLPEKYIAMGSMEFARRMMEDAEVAVAPGIGFGPEGEGYLRLALIENRPRLQQAVRQIGRAFQKWDSEDPSGD